ncbi:hypothetical protein QQS21_010779 [Conoideocrella luteorostrata]|uniref:Uncharacterized protein n=1 Tax=Conoideocrella luteorostrata TaxID=1105319 RepID=A0AAJ0CH40_9HYPO|nr:hypothetical protein QQS21_010779 [Conoideocrella luteorostrata]
MAKADGVKVYVFCYDFGRGDVDGRVPGLHGHPGLLRVGEVAQHHRQKRVPDLCREAGPYIQDVLVQNADQDRAQVGAHAPMNEFRTMRLKQPTVDLIYEDGKLHTSDNGVMVPVAVGDVNMEGGVVYEMDLVKDTTTNAIMVMKPRSRVAKKVPNFHGCRGEGDRQHGQSLDRRRRTTRLDVDVILHAREGVHDGAVEGGQEQEGDRDVRRREVPGSGSR